MNNSPVFEWLAGELGARTGLDSLKSRGTLRLALQSAGLEPRTLTQEEARVLVQRVLPDELRLRGVRDPGAVCLRIDASLGLMSFEKTGPESAETAFARLGGGRR